MRSTRPTVFMTGVAVILAAAIAQGAAAPDKKAPEKKTADRKEGKAAAAGAVTNQPAYPPGTLLKWAVDLMGPAPADTPKTPQVATSNIIVCVGDAVSGQGYDCQYGFMRSMNACFNKHYPGLKIPSVSNSGGSEVGAGELAALIGGAAVHWKVKESTPAALICSIGTYDIAGGEDKPWDEQKVVSSFKGSLAYGLMSFRKTYPACKIVLVSPALLGESADAEGTKRLSKLAVAMKEVADQNKFQFVDLNGMMLDALKKRAAGRKIGALTTDGIHLGPRGHAIYSVAVLRALGVPDDKIAATEVPIPRKYDGQVVLPNGEDMPGSKPAAEAGADEKK